MATKNRATAAPRYFKVYVGAARGLRKKVCTWLAPTWHCPIVDGVLEAVRASHIARQWMIGPVQPDDAWAFGGFGCSAGENVPSWKYGKERTRQRRRNEHMNQKCISKEPGGERPARIRRNQNQSFEKQGGPYGPGTAPSEGALINGADPWGGGRGEERKPGPAPKLVLV